MSASGPHWQYLVQLEGPVEGAREGLDPLLHQLVGPLLHLMLQGFCPRYYKLWYLQNLINFAIVEKSSGSLKFIEGQKCQND